MESSPGEMTPPSLSFVSAGSVKYKRRTSGEEGNSRQRKPMTAAWLSVFWHVRRDEKGTESGRDFTLQVGTSSVRRKGSVQ